MGTSIAVDAMWLFLTATCVDLQCVIVIFPDHTHLLFYNCNIIYMTYL